MQSSRPDVLPGDVAHERRHGPAPRGLSDQHVAQLLDVVADAIVSVDESQRITLFNRGAEAVFGYAADEVLGKPLELLLPEAARERHAAHVAAFATAPETARFMNRRGEIVGRRRNGEYFPAEATISRIAVDGRLVFTAVLRDVTERQRVEDELARAREHTEAILTSADEGIVGLDRDGRVTFANPAAARLLGHAAERLVGCELHPLIHHTHADGRPYPRDACPTWAAVHDGVATRCADDVYWRADGTPMPVEYTSTPFRLGGRVEGAVLIFRDISERKRAEEALHALSFGDDLTGLYNRRGFLSLAGQALRQARRAQSPCVLLYLDLNDFKAINDTHGHLAGDRALAEVGAMLRAVFRESDVLGRIGGDEFVVLAVGGGAAALEAHQARLQAWLDERNAGDTAACTLSVSVGAALFDPAAPASLEQLLDEADARLYALKRARNAWRAPGSLDAAPVATAG